MKRQIELRLEPRLAFDQEHIETRLKEKSSFKPGQLFSYRLIKRSLDARKKPVYLLRFIVFVDQEPEIVQFNPGYKQVNDAKKVIIAGSGPAGLFAALKLIENGIKPIIIERGKDVRSRRKDLAAISRLGIVNPNSNYCFGEGGAGTYSDGKLYTRSKKKGNVLEILQRMVYFGAPEDILIDSHPHIGTNKLPDMISAIRKTILKAGGEIHFNQHVVDIEIINNRITSFISHTGQQFKGDSFILATGHSASDIYYLLHRKNIALEQKPFAMGVRIEHPQTLIDRIQYHCDLRDEFLPPSSYTLVNQVNKRGVYSFCMCPGGVIAPCATAQNEIVTNGWSPSKRNNPFANSGIVVTVNENDTLAFKKEGPLAGLAFRSAIEHQAWKAGGSNQFAPAQRLMDFIKGKLSKNLPESSYRPGISPVELKEILPEFIVEAIQKSLLTWGKRMPGFLSNNAVLIAVESRTSSPVRIPRDTESLAHIEIKNLYPAGEGAGYAGGIISAAIDGERCALQIAEKINKQSFK